MSEYINYLPVILTLKKKNVANEKVMEQIFVYKLNLKCNDVKGKECDIIICNENSRNVVKIHKTFFRSSGYWCTKNPRDLRQRFKVNKNIGEFFSWFATM